MRDEPTLLNPEPKLILRELLRVCQEVRSSIQKYVSNAPNISYLPVSNPGKDASNLTRTFDGIAEEWFVNGIKPLFAGNVEVLGEESPSLKTAKFHGFQGTVFLGDMVDGSDLLMAGLGNWCSTAVCFSPVRKRILAAVVAHADGRIYFARDDRDGAGVSIRFVTPRPPGTEVSRIQVDRNVKNIFNAKLCHYGQKWQHMLVPDRTFCDAMGDQGRVYNLGGNPMMAKLAEGRVHAVFDVTGQSAHDVVPGAYIALKAGAVMSTPGNEPIDESYLYEKLLEPSKKVKYVLAASEGLRKEICERLCNVKTMRDFFSRPK